MRIALVIGNRYSPWHFQVYGRLPGHPEVTIFRAESEIQQYFDQRGDETLDQQFHFEHIRFDNVRYRLLSRLRRCEPRIRPFHDRLTQFDLVQTWELFTDWSDEAVTARRNGGPPVAVMVWDNIPFNMETDRRRREIKHRVKQYADLFIVHTELSRRMLHLEGVTDERIAYLPPAVDIDRFAPADHPQPRPDLPFTILFVGWFLPRKGLPVLLYALRGLIDDTDLKSLPLRLEIVGSGPGEADIKSLIDRLHIGSSCRFRGSVPYADMPELYRAADLFVFPSIPTPEWQEQFGMALIEAMSCGVPAISTWSGAIPEIARDAAVLCAPGNSLSLQQTIKELLLDTNLRKSLGRAGRERASQTYSLKDLAEGLSRLYSSLV